MNNKYLINFYISSLLIAFSFGVLGDMATQLSHDFKSKNPELYTALLKAEAYCTPSEKFTDEMIEVVQDSVSQQCNRFQGCSYFAKLTRLPVAIVSASSAAAHKGYNWYYSIQDQEDAGQVGKRALISMMLETQQKHNLSQPQTACMAACVSRVMLKIVSPYKDCRVFTSLFAPTEQLLRCREGTCVGSSQMFETFANELGLPTYSFPQRGASVGAAVLAINAANYAHAGNLYSRSLALCNIVNFSSMIQGHYMSQIKLDGRNYIFDTVHDYNSKTYRCRFHER